MAQKDTLLHLFAGGWVEMIYIHMNPEDDGSQTGRSIAALNAMRRLDLNATLISDQKSILIQFFCYKYLLCDILKMSSNEDSSC